MHNSNLSSLQLFFDKYLYIWIFATVVIIYIQICKLWIDFKSYKSDSEKAHAQTRLNNIAIAIILLYFIVFPGLDYFFDWNFFPTKPSIKCDSPPYNLNGTSWRAPLVVAAQSVEMSSIENVQLFREIVPNNIYNTLTYDTMTDQQKEEFVQHTVDLAIYQNRVSGLANVSNSMFRNCRHFGDMVNQHLHAVDKSYWTSWSMNPPLHPNCSLGRLASPTHRFITAMRR